jgi:hypothetical protein
MVYGPFLTLTDPRAKIKGSRDPLGIQILWTKLGRQVVHNLTTVTTSVRSFSVLLLGLYFAERAVSERHASPDQFAELFLKFEQLAAYSRVALHADKNGDYTEEEIRGIQRVKKNLVDRRVRISTEPRWQILADQKTYGLWGLYMVAARNSELVQAEAARLTENAREFVAEEYDNQKRINRQESEKIIDFLCHERWFEPFGKDSKLARKIASLLGGLNTNEKHIYRKHLVECMGTEMQSSLWKAMLAVTRSELPFSMDDLSEIIKHSRVHGQNELAGFLSQIQAAERVFAPAAYLFSFMSSRDGQSQEKVASEIRQAWGPKLRTVNPIQFAEVLDRFPGGLDVSTCNRLKELGNSFAEGNYGRSLELLIEQNRAVMQARGGLAWIEIKNKVISVSFKENAGPLPAREDIPILWTNSYFLNALKTIGYQIERATL